MKILEFKYKRPKVGYEGYTDILVKGIVVGYFIPIRSLGRKENENWSLCLYAEDKKYSKWRTRKELVQFLNEKLEQL
jgi:hypothetical protein